MIFSSSSIWIILYNRLVFGARGKHKTLCFDKYTTTKIPKKIEEY